MARHMFKMKVERSLKIYDTKRQNGCNKRRTPQLRWEDGRKRGLRKAEEGHKWRAMVLS